MQAIKKKATTINGFSKAPQLLTALQNNINTDMSLSDMRAIYDWGKNLPDSGIIRVALTAPSGAAEGNLLDSFNCGMGPNVSQLCADDPSFTMTKLYVGSLLVPPAALDEKAPIQIVDGSGAGLESRVTTMFDPTGLQLSDPVVHGGVAQTVILDYSNGRFPLTARWLTAFFGANIVPATPASAPPASGQQTYGLVIVLGHDFARRWYGG
jgi:hypothetical protein